MTDQVADLSDPCPVRDVIERVGDKWSVLVINRLDGEPRRFGVLARTVEGISRNMLTRTLRLLERDGLVTRTVYPTAPPTVEYALTDLGRSLVPPLNALAKLGGPAPRRRPGGAGRLPPPARRLARARAVRLRPVRAPDRAGARRAGIPRSR